MRKFFFGCIALSTLVAAPATAADMAVKQPVYKSPVSRVVAHNWTGFYLGGNVGYSWGLAHEDNNVTITALGAGLNFGNNFITPSSASLRSRLNGALGGIQAGFNWQRESWVYGLEADIQATGQRGDSLSQFSGFLGAIVNGVPATGTITYTANYKLPWFATFRGRLGLAGERWLLYGTGGLAVAKIEASSAAILTFSDPFIGPTTPAQPSATRDVRAGWVLGAGIEAALTDRWSFKVEYLHLNFGGFDHAFSTPTVPTAFANITSAGNLHTRFTDDIVRVGVNYRFGSAVVAAY